LTQQSTTLYETGKQFNRAVRALTLVDEALSSLWLSAFFEWCRENDILTALKDKLSLVLASPRFFRISYFQSYHAKVISS
jgi:ferric-dicitrate binding protein FerR (iron transport regulator)